MNTFTLEVLEEHGTLRFTRLGELVGGVSQKTPTKTLRQMEAEGLLIRKMFPVIPPRVEYTLTDLGLSVTFCGACEWGRTHQQATLQVRLDARVSNPNLRDESITFGPEQPRP